MNIIHHHQHQFTQPSEINTLYILVRFSFCDGMFFNKWIAGMRPNQSLKLTELAVDDSMRAQ